MSSYIGFFLGWFVNFSAAKDDTGDLDDEIAKIFDQIKKFELIRDTGTRATRERALKNLITLNLTLTRLKKCKKIVLSY